MSELYEQVRAAMVAAHQAGIKPTAVVVGEEQLTKARASANLSTSPFNPHFSTFFGLAILSSPKVVGPMVVTDDVRHSLQQLGIFHV